MSDEINISEVTEEIRNASEEELRKVMEDWYERTRTDGLKIGAKMMSAVIYDKIQKHLKKASKPSLRDYQRCIDDILKLISVQLTQQNDLAPTEEVANDE